MARDPHEVAFETLRHLLGSLKELLSQPIHPALPNRTLAPQDWQIWCELWTSVFRLSALYPHAVQRLLAERESLPETAWVGASLKHIAADRHPESRAALVFHPEEYANV